MMIKAGSTSRMVTVYAFDATTGLPYVTAAYNDSGISLWYRRGTVGAVTAITPATQTVTGAYSSGGFILLNAADNAYRFDIPDAAFAAGVDEVEIGGHATAWKLIGPTVQLTGADPRTEWTGDAYARIGAAGAGLTAVGDTAGTTTLLSRVGTPSNLGGGATVAANLADIEAQTDDIGTAGAGLTAVPWNAAWDAEVQSEVADALAATDAITAATLSATAIAKVADAVLRRTAANIEASANGDALSVESLYGVVMASFEAALSGTTLTVRKSDGTTLGTKTVSVDATADPITGIT